MQRVEARAQNLSCSLQMMQVGTGEMATGIAGALVVGWSSIQTIPAIAQLDDAVACEEPAIARVAGRQHTVEHVYSQRDGMDNICRRADSHQVARPFGRQLRGSMLEYALHVGLGLAYRQPANGIAVEADLQQS